MRKFVAVFLLSTACLAVTMPALTFAQSTLLPGCEEGSLPSGDQKFPASQLILVCIPANWNGNLVLYAHGYVPPQASLALPIEELTLDGTFFPQLLLTQGFAFATSSFHKNGAAIQQGAEDLNDLLAHFKTLVSEKSLQNILLIGASEGGLIAVELLERKPHDYDAALALAAPSAAHSSRFGTLMISELSSIIFFRRSLRFRRGYPARNTSERSMSRRTPICFGRPSTCRESPRQ